jgi:flagellar motor switch protein FliN
MAEEQPPNSDNPSADSAANSSSPGGLDALDQSAIEELLKGANFEDAPAPDEQSTAAQAGQDGDNAPAIDAAPMELPSFQQVMRDAQVSSIDLLRDVDLNVKIELGRSRMLVEDVLKLGEGSVVELDKLAGDPVDVFVNERLIARGEVLVLNDNFCVRINEIVAGVKEEGL